jgi:hypothetical protein
MKSVDIARDVVEGRVAGRYRVEFNKLALTVSATGAAAGFGSAVLAGLPQGNLLIFGARSSVQISTTDADISSAVFEGDVSVGTTPTADATLATTEVNIMPSTPIGPAVGKVAPAVSARLAAPPALTSYFDNTAGALELNLNVLIDAGHIVDDSSAVLLATGWVDVFLAVMP